MSRRRVMTGARDCPRHVGVVDHHRARRPTQGADRAPAAARRACRRPGRGSGACSLAPRTWTRACSCQRRQPHDQDDLTVVVRDGCDARDETRARSAPEQKRARRGARVIAGQSDDTACAADRAVSTRVVPGIGTIRVTAREPGQRDSNGVAPWRAARSPRTRIAIAFAPSLRAPQRPVREQLIPLREAVVDDPAEDGWSCQRLSSACTDGDLRDPAGLLDLADGDVAQTDALDQPLALAARRARARSSRAASADRARAADRGGCDRPPARAGSPHTRRRGVAPARPGPSCPAVASGRLSSRRGCATGSRPRASARAISRSLCPDSACSQQYASAVSRSVTPASNAACRTAIATRLVAIAIGGEPHAAHRDRRGEAAGPMDVITTEVSWENRGESLNQEQDSGSMVNWVNVGSLALASSVPADGRVSAEARASGTRSRPRLQPRPAARQSRRKSRAVSIPSGTWAMR